MIKGSLSKELLVSDFDELINRMKAWFESRGYELRRIETKDKGSKLDRKYVFRKTGFIKSAYVWVYVKGKGEECKLEIKYSVRKSAIEDIDALTKFLNVLPNLVSPRLEKEEGVIKCPVCGYVVTDLKTKVCPQCGAKLA